MKLISGYRVEDLISPSDIAYYYSVNDIDVSYLDTYIPDTLNSRYTTNVATFNTGVGRVKPILKLDNQGYKYIEVTSTSTNTHTYYNTQVITPNNNETFIGIFSLENDDISYWGLTPYLTLQMYNSISTSYANFIVNDGRIVFNNGNGKYFTPPSIQTTKNIISSSVNSSKMTMWYNNNYVRIFFSNPTLKTDLNPVVDSIFNLNGSGTAGKKCRYYAALRIRNTYDDLTLSKLIRSIGLEHGLMI